MYPSPKNKGGYKAISTDYFKGSLTKCEGREKGKR